MERLTQRLRTGEVLMATDYEEKYTEQEWINMLQNRLAAYEDTGLEPREVSAIVKEWSDLCTIVGECGGIARLRELAEADKGGRLVVLPCKVGDIVWANLNKMRHTRKCVIEFANIGSHITTIVFSTVDGLREQYGVNPCSFGKTVFLTREEAEKVLEAKEGCNP